MSHNKKNDSDLSVLVRFQWKQYFFYFLLGNAFLTLIQRYKDLQELSYRKESEVLQKVQQAAQHKQGYGGVTGSFNAAATQEEQKQQELMELVGVPQQQQKLVSWQESTVQVETRCEVEKNELVTKMADELQEINTMFVEFKTLVDTQGEQLDLVHDYVDKSVINVELGVEEIRTARGYQKVGRWILLLVLAVVVVVALATVALVFTGMYSSLEYLPFVI